MRSCSASARAAPSSPRPREQLGELAAQLLAPLHLVQDRRGVLLAADHGAELLEERAQAAARAPARHRARDRRAHLHHVERLLEIVADADPHRLGGALDRGAARDHDDLDVRKLLVHAADQVLTAHAGHVEIDRHDVDRARCAGSRARRPRCPRRARGTTARGSCAATRAARARRRRPGSFRECARSSRLSARGVRAMHRKLHAQCASQPAIAMPTSRVISRNRALPRKAAVADRPRPCPFVDATGRFADTDQLANGAVRTRRGEDRPGLHQIGRVEPLGEARVRAAQRLEVGARAARDRHRRAQLERERLLIARDRERLREREVARFAAAVAPQQQQARARGGPPRAARSRRECSRAAPLRARRRSPPSSAPTRASACASWRWASPVPSAMPSARRISSSARASSSAACARPPRSAHLAADAERRGLEDPVPETRRAREVRLGELERAVVLAAPQVDVGDQRIGDALVVGLAERARDLERALRLAARAVGKAVQPGAARDRRVHERERVDARQRSSPLAGSHRIEVLRACAPRRRAPPCVGPSKLASCARAPSASASRWRSPLAAATSASSPTISLARRRRASRCAPGSPTGRRTCRRRRRVRAAQRVRARERALDLGRVAPARGEQRAAELEQQAQLELVALAREPAISRRGRERPLEVAGGLDVRGGLERAVGGALPGRGGEIVLRRALVVVREHLGIARRSTRGRRPRSRAPPARAARRGAAAGSTRTPRRGSARGGTRTGDPGGRPCPRSAGACSSWWSASSSARSSGARRACARTSRENARPITDGDLRDPLLVAETIEPRHQRIVERGGDRVVVGAGLARVARELSGEQRVALGARHDRVDRGLPRRGRPRRTRRSGACLCGVERSELGSRARCRAAGAAELELGAHRADQEHAQLGADRVREPQHLERRGIGPVQILDHEHERVQLADALRRRRRSPRTSSRAPSSGSARAARRAPRSASNRSSGGSRSGRAI